MASPCQRPQGTIRGDAALLARDPLGIQELDVAAFPAACKAPAIQPGFLYRIKSGRIAGFKIEDAQLGPGQPESRL